MLKLPVYGWTGNGKTPLKDRGETPYNDLYGEAPPERGAFLRLQVYERGGISLVVVYGTVETYVIFGSKKVQKGKQMKFMAVKKKRENVLVLWFSNFQR